MRLFGLEIIKQRKVRSVMVVQSEKTGEWYWKFQTAEGRTIVCPLPHEPTREAMLQRARNAFCDTEFEVV